MDKKYYIYVYYREDKTPYYIGKGCDSRITGQHYVKVPDEEYREKLFENLWEEEAYIIESELINQYGRIGIDKGGILKNKAAGRYSMEEIAEIYKEQEEQQKRDAEWDEWQKEIDEEWQWELDKLIWIKDNSPSMWNEIYNTYWEYKIESALTSCDKEYEESIEYETADALVNGHTTVESYNESLV
tara:strand:- start:58 stop:615 length:558 start_codon:yes stop_codon:yes gene_type:complete